MDINVQLIFYILSPIGTFAAVATAYYAIYRQTKPSIVVFYEVSSEKASFIDLVIKNIGNGTARDIKFSEQIPICCFGISKPADRSQIIYLDDDFKIPILSPNKEMRFIGGQYVGLKNELKDSFEIKVRYNFSSPLKSDKRAEDISFLTVEHLLYQNTKNSADQDISDAVKGRNNTVFSQMNLRLEKIEKVLLKLTTTP